MRGVRTVPPLGFPNQVRGIREERLFEQGRNLGAWFQGSMWPLVGCSLALKFQEEKATTAHGKDRGGKQTLP